MTRQIDGRRREAPATDRAMRLAADATLFELCTAAPALVEVFPEELVEVVDDPGLDEVIPRMTASVVVVTGRPDDRGIIDLVPMASGINGAGIVVDMIVDEPGSVVWVAEEELEVETPEVGDPPVEVLEEPDDGGMEEEDDDDDEVTEEAVDFFAKPTQAELASQLRRGD